MFATLGVGHGAPYLLLTLFPALLRRLPRPGRWMELFKQVMAFPMFATCVWLLWVLAQQVDAGGVGLALAVVVAVGFAAWALGLSQRGAYPFRWVALAGALVAALAFAPLATTEPPQVAKTASSDDWVEYSPEKLAQLRGEGKPVFVDFTAAWCVTCQVNKRVALNRGRGDRRFAAAAWCRCRPTGPTATRASPQALAQLGRNARAALRPLRARAGAAELLPEVLTDGIARSSTRSEAGRPAKRATERINPR